MWIKKQNRGIKYVNEIQYKKKQIKTGKTCSRNPITLKCFIETKIEGGQVTWGASQINIRDIWKASEKYIGNHQAARKALFNHNC